MPLVPPGAPLTGAQRARYARQLLLPGVGEEGQRRLAAARVLLVGAGGLGSPATLYLAAAGVGVLGVVDDDAVDVSNLQRQVLHSDADLGRPKVESAGERVRALNPHVEVVQHARRLDASNALALCADYDVVVDGSDNFPTRALVSAATSLLGIPHVWASVSRFDAQLSIWWPPLGPCYHCVFPRQPAPGQVPSCAVGGVLGATVGSVGSVLAVEVVKLLVGVGDPLVGRLLVHDSLAQRWDEVPVSRNPGCQVCGEGVPSHGIPSVLVGAGGTPPAEAAAGTSAPGSDGVPSVTVVELAALRRAGADGVVLDVREAAERTIAVLDDDLHLPLDTLRAGDIPDGLLGRRVWVYCRSGARSQEAVSRLRAAGVDAVNVEGGVLAWAAQIDPAMTTY